MISGIHLVHMTKGRENTQDPIPCFNLVAHCLAAFHTWLSFLPTLEGDISRRRHTSGFISFLESPNLVMISFCRQNYICLETCNANFTFHLPKHAVAHIPFSNGRFAMSTECIPSRNLLELVWLLGPPRLVKSGTLQCQRNAGRRL